MTVGKVYHDANGFSTKARLDYKDDRGQSSATFVFRQSNSKLSTAFRLTDFGQPPEQTKRMLRSLSDDEFIALLDLKTGQFDIISPDVKGFIRAEAPPKLKKLIGLMGRPKNELLPLVEETLEGVKCNKVRVVDRESPDVTTTAWLDAGQKNFPRRIEIVRGVEVTRIDLSLPAPLKTPESEFQVPAGYTQFDNFSELLKTASTNALERMAKPATKN